MMTYVSPPHWIRPLWGGLLSGRGTGLFLRLFLGLFLGLLLCCLHAPLVLAYDEDWNGGREDITGPSPEPPEPCPGGDCGCPGENNTGSPVYLGDGSLIWRDTDISLLGETGIGLRRSYNSYDYRAGLFGRGWVSEQEVNIARTYRAITEANADGSPRTATEFASEPIWLSGWGRRYTLEEGAEACTPPGVLHFSFKKEADGGFRQVYADNDSYKLYSASGQLLQAYTDKDGSTLYYHYDEQGRLIRQQDSYGLSLDFHYNAQGFIGVVQDQSGRSWHYHYDAFGRLTAVDDPDGHRRVYRYTLIDNIGYRQHLLTAVEQTVTPPGVEDPAADSGTTDSETTESGTEASEVADTGVEDPVADSETTDSETTDSETTESEAPDSEVPAVAESETTEPARHIILQVDWSAIALPFGQAPLMRVSRYTDAEGRRHDYRYAQGNVAGQSVVLVTKETYQVGGETLIESQRFTVDPLNLRILETHNLATSTRLSRRYNDRGQLIEQTDARGNITRYHYNAQGRKTQHIELADTEQEKAIHYHYWQDSTGRETDRIAREVHYSILERRYTYDHALRPLSRTEHDLQTGEQRVWHYSYHPDSADSQGNQILGKLSQTTDPQGHLTRYHYNAQGRLIQLELPLGQSRHYQYNTAGQRIAETEPNGLIRTMRYDSSNRLIQLNHGGRETHYHYDALGRLLSLTDPLGRRTTLRYTPAGQLSQITYPSGDSLTLDRQYSPGHIETSQRYYQATGTADNTAGDEQTGRLLYTRIDRQHPRSRLPLASYLASLDEPVSSQIYNNLDELIAQIHHHGQTVPDAGIGYQYDSEGRLIKLTQPDGGWVVMHYDAFGRTIQVDNPQQGSTHYRYNAWGESLGQTSPDTGEGHYTNNQNGQRSRSTDALGQTTHYHYDALGRLTRLDAPGEDLDIQQHYDTDTGRLGRVEDSTGITHYRYTPHGELAAVAHEQDGVRLESHYTYNMAGEPTALHYPSGIRLNINRDLAGRLTGLTLAQTEDQTEDDEAVTTLLHNIQWHGQALASYQHGNTLTTQLNYDTAGRLNSKHTTDQTDTHGWTWQRDNQDHITQQQTDEQDGRHYQYTPLGQLAAEQDPDGTTTHYTYNTLGNRIARWEDNGPRTSYQHTPGSSRLSQVGETLIQTDAAGNTLDDGRYQYHYNSLNRLQTVHAPDGHTPLASYTYNHLGQRLHKQTDEQDIRYHYGPYGELLGEYTSAGERITEYLYHYHNPYPEPIAQIDALGELHYIHTDHLGTPRFITDTAGVIRWRWAGEAFGHSLPDEDPDGDGETFSHQLRFPGQYYDEETGLHYNHHRYYDPSTGRYITSDPIGLEGGINTYLYANANPIINIDPTGEFPWLAAAALVAGVCAKVAWDKSWELFSSDDKKRHCYVSCAVNRCTGLLFPYVIKWIGDLWERFNGVYDPEDIDANIYGIAYSLLPRNCKDICECY